MKKIWMIFCFSLLFCSTVFFGCENKENQNEEIVLRIANWEEYLDEGGWDEDETIDLDEKTKILGRENMVDEFESWYEKTREMLLFFYYPSDEYISYLMTVEELLFSDEIDCRDLFDGNNVREKIMIFEIAV